MKYYEGPEELKDVIECYIVIGDYLKIFYLNGESIEKYDKEHIYEEKTKQIMIRQLQERNDSIETNYINFLKNTDIFAAISLLSLYLANYIGHKDIPTITTILTFFTSSILLSKANDIKKIQKEVKKSQLFLEIYDFLQNNKEKMAVDKLEFYKICGRGELNVNTLDTFRYGEVKRIHKTLKRIK